jgi:hypothetical protein
MLLGWRSLADCETGAAVSSHASRLLQAARRVVRPMAAASVIDRPEAVVGNEYGYSGEPVVRQRRADRSSWAIGAVRVCLVAAIRHRAGSEVGPPPPSESQTGKPDGTGRRGIGFSLRRIGKLRRPGGRWFCFCGDPGTRASPPGGRAHESPTRGRMSRAVRGLFPGRPERLASTLPLARCDHNWGLAAAMVGEELSMVSRVY